MKLKYLVLSFAPLAAAVPVCALGAAAESTNSLPAEVKLEKGKEEKKTKWPEWDRAAISLGGNVVGLNSSIGFGAQGAPSVSISAESILNMQTSLFVMAGGAYYRFGETKRNQVSFSYSAYHRSGTAQLTEEIQVGDTVLVPGTIVNSVFNFDLIHATYSYAIVQDERVRLGIGAGLYVSPIKASLDWSSTSGGGGGESETITLPLPTLNVDAEIRITPRLSLVGSVDAMYLKVNGFSGSLLNTYMGLEYRLWRHFGLGLTFNALNVNVEGSASSSKYPGADFVGSINVQYGGLFMYGKLAF
ncbi:MAG: hypothetical protein U1F98_09780 [Verrucomicrobiota bacterium]